jgi:O-antigen ligase
VVSPLPEQSRRESALRILPWAFGLAPLFLILMTWNNHDSTWWIKLYALPVAAVELITVGVAFLGGMRIRLTLPSACLAGLLLLAWITVFFAPDPMVSVFTTELWTLHALFGFAAARLFQPQELTRAILAGFIASMVALAIFAATAPPGVNWVGELPGLGNPRSFALYASLAIGLGMGLLAEGKSWPVAVIILGFTMAFWSGSRGAIYASSATLIACMVLFPSVRRPKVWGLMVGSALAGAALARLVGSPALLFGVSRMTEAGDNGRFALWRSTIALISHRPWFGYGEGQTDYLLHIPWTMHPHNIFLQVLLAWGIVGFALVSGLSWWAMRQCFARVSEKTLPLALAIATLAFYSLVDGAIYNVHTTAVFAACLGVLLSAPLQSEGGMA